MSEIKNANEVFHLENAIGTPSAQKVLLLLVTWPSLSIKDLISKSKLSKSQIHGTLKNLQHIGLVTAITRGQYSLENNKFSHLLQEAYIEKIIETLNKQIYVIKQLLKNNDLQKATELYDEIYSWYEPILKRNFSYILSSLANSFIEAYGR